MAGFFSRDSVDRELTLSVVRTLDRIATALEVIVRESYGINLDLTAPDLSLEISYTDPETAPPDPPHASSNVYPAVGDEDPEDEVPSVR